MHQTGKWFRNKSQIESHQDFVCFHPHSRMMKWTWSFAQELFHQWKMKPVEHTQLKIAKLKLSEEENHRAEDATHPWPGPPLPPRAQLSLRELCHGNIPSKHGGGTWWTYGDSGSVFPLTLEALASFPSDLAPLGTPRPIGVATHLRPVAAAREAICLSFIESQGTSSGESSLDAHHFTTSTCSQKVLGGKWPDLKKKQASR